LDDAAGVLEEQGPNSRSARRIRLTSVTEVDELADIVRHYVGKAIEVEDAGLDVGPAPEPVLVEELRHRLDRDAAVRAGFEALTPGRKREYHLYISSAEHAATREARIEKCAPKILAGKGMRSR
jgi:uncharacterized protein YdeI (YjbR/CyaY-like superfamily)